MDYQLEFCDEGTGRMEILIPLFLSATSWSLNPSYTETSQQRGSRVSNCNQQRSSCKEIAHVFTSWNLVLRFRKKINRT